LHAGEIGVGLPGVLSITFRGVLTSYLP